jgi:hypothetical protein
MPYGPDDGHRSLFIASLCRRTKDAVDLAIHAKHSFETPGLKPYADLLYIGVTYDATKPSG